jgi:UDP-2-acetamido-3-amino-2,3-dideoxy-glucuronate N-acetyltransferase
MNNYKTSLKSINDDRGNLVVIENLKNVPFEIKRVYYLTKLSAEHPRGFHAHKILKQFAVCLAGSCRFVMDNGIQKEEFTLSSPSEGIIINEMIWHEMHDFSQDCVLMVLANDFYDESDYIRDYPTFLKLINLERK